ncbi:hypothetical protein BST99_00465 [Aureicoccus marinus]|uniref:Uncharacterized protein n=1 Tax=Aureicoccus marinus TaxID=754435 RepID=A0A2S7T3C3_9FLAO|nr:hypothetical protein BST99_00465 [Aureicoccus marinus]
MDLLRKIQGGIIGIAILNRIKARFVRLEEWEGYIYRYKNAAWVVLLKKELSICFIIIYRYICSPKNDGELT